MLEGTTSWDAAYQAECDLGDIQGAPQVSGETLVSTITGVLGGHAQDVGPAGAPFIVGTLPGGEASVLERLSAPGIVDARRSDGHGATSTLVTFSSATGEHAVVQQTLRGAEVLGARYRVHHRQGSHRYALTGRPVGDLRERDPGTPPESSTEADALAAFEARFGRPTGPAATAERLIMPLGGGSIWAWQVRGVFDEPPMNLRAFFSATDLSFLLSYNIASADSLYGDGQVFRVNPSRTPDLAVGTLREMGPQHSDGLQGKYLQVSPRTGAPVKDAMRHFAQGPDDVGFDEVQAFYHLERGIRWFRTLLGEELFGKTPFSPLYAVVRDSTAPNNSFFIPDSAAIRLGDFGDRPSARCADVVLHELGHAVSDSICRLGRSEQRNTPARGMSEGYSDYFAASALDDPRIADYVADMPDGARNLAKADLTLAGITPAEEHREGEVWGSLLWSLRTVLGPDIADLLAAESLQYLGPQQSYEDGCAALVEADRVLFPADATTGRHKDAVTAAFEAHR